MPSIIAHVFAIWTLLNSTNFFQTSADKDSLFKPHPAQVISIFRMLDVGYRERVLEKVKGKIKGLAKELIPDRISEKIFEVNGLRNNLIQIGTGEGKSVTLAVTVIVLALLGFDTYCVCFSDYLSKRDFDAFKSLFEKLNLLEFIHYGTFNQICENTINRIGNIRNIVGDLLKTNKLNLTKNKLELKRPRVLLIDEVDVFFSKDFYGNHFKPCLNLHDPSITKLITFIWKHRSNISLQRVRSSEEFSDCCARFYEWRNLIEEICKDMIYDLKSLESHDYIIENDRIGYKEQDGIAFDTLYGYKTLFSYFQENENGKISDESLDENISMLVKLGTFSYSEIPR